MLSALEKLLGYSLFTINIKTGHKRYCNKQTLQTGKEGKLNDLIRKIRISTVSHMLKNVLYVLFAQNV